MNNRNKKYQRRKRRYESKLLDLSRVAHTREGGRRLSFRAVMVLGDQKGKIGVGVGSGSDVAQGIQKASRKAEKNMIEVPIINGTIPHPVEAKYSAARVLLKPQREKRGLVAGGTVRIMCNLAGIKDISSKVLGGTSNKLNNARAVIKAFKKLRKIDDETKKQVEKNKELKSKKNKKESKKDKKVKEK